MSDTHVIWFKRDLRVHDHAPLAAATVSGAPVIALYMFEPGLWAQPDHSRRQFEFLKESLAELDEALKARGTELVLRTGNAIDVFSSLHRQYGLAAIHAYEETPAGWIGERNRTVLRWARHAGISVREQALPELAGSPEFSARQNASWETFIAQPRITAPDLIRSAGAAAGTMPLASDLGLDPDSCPHREAGGRSAGVEVFRRFAAETAPGSTTGNTGPVAASEVCARLSPHLAFGTISMREVWQAARAAEDACRQSGNTGHASSLGRLLSHLRWRCELAQISENLPDGTQGKRLSLQDRQRPEASLTDPRLAAWLEGRTGFPFIDACLRSLRATGWLDYRLRGHMFSFLAHHLWLDWKIPAEMLAALFTDFEPGLHYAQARLQSERGPMLGAQHIGDPVQQSRNLDRNGDFIRRWIPELAELPDQWLHAPWDAPMAVRARAGIILGQTYPMRIVDHLAAAEEARSRLLAARRHEPPPVSARAMADRFASREAGPKPRKPGPRRSSGLRRGAEPAQLSFDLGASPQAHVS